MLSNGLIKDLINYSNDYEYYEVDSINRNPTAYINKVTEEIEEGFNTFEENPEVILSLNNYYENLFFSYIEYKTVLLFMEKEKEVFKMEDVEFKSFKKIFTSEVAKLEGILKDFIKKLKDLPEEELLFYLFYDIFYYKMIAKKEGNFNYRYIVKY